MSHEDLTLILRQLAGTALSDDEIEYMVDKAFVEGGGSIDKGAFSTVLRNQDFAMEVDFPIHF